jgi:hypothetical protein
MPDKVFGLSVTEVMAYAAIANVILVLVLVSINIYYAWHAKRKADASSAQVHTANRQREIAAETLSILRKQIELQRTADLATVGLQLKVPAAAQIVSSLPMRAKVSLLASSTMFIKHSRIDQL